MKRHPSLLLLALLLALGLLALTMGPVRIPLVHPDSAQSYILFQLRLPRIVSAIFCGAVLAIAGSVFQAVFRNPMADPFVLGISSGASFGVALSLALGYATVIGLPLSALFGALAASFAIFAFGTRRQIGKTTLLLTGVAANYILSAAMTLLMFLNHEQYERILFWTLGSFSASTWQQVLVTGACTIGCLIPIFAHAEELDMLLLDDGSALASGLHIKGSRLLLLTLSTFGVAVSVSYFGVIGFVGLMAPHIVRLVLGPRHRRNLLPTALFGSLLLLGSDTLARIILKTGEMPVGVITSLLGAPLFVWMLRKGRYTYD